MKRYFLLIGIFVFSIFAVADADTVFLKNGRSLEGLVKKETAEAIELEINGGTVKFYQYEIERIVKGTSEEENYLRKKWQNQNQETLERLAKQKEEEARKPKGTSFSIQEEGLTLEATLNNKVKAILVLDTGATMTVLSRDIADKLGLDVEKSKNLGKLRVADGREIKAVYVVLDSIKVENAEAKKVEAAIVVDENAKFSSPDGFIGMSFLKYFNFKIDHKNKKLILEKVPGAE